MLSFNYRTKQCILLVGDIVTFFTGLWVAVLIRQFQIPDITYIKSLLPLFGVVFFCWIVINYISSLYDIEQVTYTKQYYKRFTETAVISFVVGIIFFYLSPNKDIAPKTILLLTAAIGYSGSAIWRRSYKNIFRAKRLTTNVMFVGYNNEIKELITLLQHQPEKGFKINTIIDPEKSIDKEEMKDIEIYHGLHTIRPAITSHHINLVVIAPHLRKNVEALRELYELLFWSVEITDLTSFYEQITGRIPPSTFSEGWFLDHIKNTTHPVYNRIRTILDYGAGFLLGLIFIILLPFIAIAIKASSKGAIFFTQTRVGKNGRQFKLYKFRSMYTLAPDGSAEIDGVQFAKKEDVRITWIGKILRKGRLDELPQALNLLKRDVTLIGPRPERPEIVQQLEERMPYYPLRHVMRPGITGWAVINQNYTDTLESSLEKLQYDLYYIKNKSLLMDMSILLRTVNVIARFMGQ